MKSAVAFIALAGCAGTAVGTLRFRNEPAVWRVDDRGEVARPTKRPFAPLLYYVDVFAADRLSKLLAVPRPQIARDINALDEVVDSTWFTNRIDSREPAVEAEAPAPPWKILGTKVGGSEPGFMVTDARGTRYLMKFDSPGSPDMETGADVVVQKILCALGYNTPEDTIVVVSRGELELAPTAKVEDVFGHARPMTAADLEGRLALVDRRSDGRYRALVSRFLSGAPLGGYPHSGMRDDDPNDRIPHEDRRSLRAQAVFFAWLDHTDINESNSLDMWVDEGGRHFVRHYLVDFGKALGVYGWGDFAASDGFAYTIDLGYSARSLVALGLWERPWEDADGERIRGVGRFEVEHFDPLHWRDRFPYTPFTRLDDADGFWAAKTMMRFTPEQLRGFVERGEYTPAAADYLTRTLVARQRKTALAWFERVNALDRFRMADAALCFDDLRLAYFTDTRRTRYELRTFDFAGTPTGWRATAAGGATACVDGIRPGGDHDGYVIVEIATRRGDATFSPVRVHLALDPASGRLRVIGIRRS